MQRTYYNGRTYYVDADCVRLGADLTRLQDAVGLGVTHDNKPITDGRWQLLEAKVRAKLAKSLGKVAV